MKIKFASLREHFTRNRILVENFTFLSILQVANLLLFLITVPYLFRVLGSDNYGLVVFAQAIVFYFSVFINFGFNLTATRDVSINRSDSGAVSNIVSSVLTVKTLLFVISMAAMVLLTAVIPKLSQYRLLFLLSMIFGLSEALFPVWYFQGIEKMKYITIINISTRLIATLLVFLLVNSPSDFILYPLITGSGALAGAIIALAVVFIPGKIKFLFITPAALIKYASGNFLYFISNVSTQLYLNANKVFAGILLGMSDLALYDIAEKIINMVKVPYSLIGQTLFPGFAKNRNLRFIRKIMIYTILTTIAGIVILWLLAGPMVVFFSGMENPGAVKVLRILSLALLPISVSLFYGDLLLITADRKIEYAALRFKALIFYISLILLWNFSGRFSLVAISLVIVLTELYVAVSSILLSRKTAFRL